LRAVLDPNVLISAALSPGGPPGRLFRHWLEGAYDLIVSAHLLEELRSALAYPKLRGRIPPADAAALIDLLRRGGTHIEDPTERPDVSSTDPDDDYLIALADRSRSIIVSGDKALLELSERLPVYSPAGFLALVERQSTDTS
jgi:uncharacterized protein